MDFRSVCDSFCGVSLFAAALLQIIYIGSFTKVAWFDLTKVVAGGMYAWYDPSDAWLCGLFDLGKLATRKSALISLSFAHKVSKSAKEN
jgi:hypothetical protein